MALIRDWPRVLQRAWSVRLSVLAVFLGACEFAIPYLQGYVDIPPRTFAALAMLTSLAAGIARIFAQASITGEKDEQKS